MRQRKTQFLVHRDLLYDYLYNLLIILCPFFYLTKLYIYPLKEIGN